MSDDERFQIIGKVVSDLANAKTHLAALEVKAKALGEFVHMVANILTGNARTFRFEVERQIMIGQYNQAPGGSGVWPTYDELGSLLNEIGTVRTRITDLERQRKDLGV